MKNFLKLLIEYLKEGLGCLLAFVIFGGLVAGAIFLPIFRIILAVALLFFIFVILVCFTVTYVDFTSFSEMEFSDLKMRYLKNSKNYAYFRNYFEYTLRLIVDILVDILFAICCFGTLVYYLYWIFLSEHFKTLWQNVIYFGF